MKHVAIIKEILDAEEGKLPILEYRHNADGPWKLVNQANSNKVTVIFWLSGNHAQTQEVRKKPEPVPDVIRYAASGSDYQNLDELKKVWVLHGRKRFYKITIKTDENGKQTKLVEIVE